MPESNPEKQVRLHLERECGTVFEAVRHVATSCPLTLLLFDFGDPGEFNNVAFKTTLKLAELVEAAASLRASFARGEQRVIDAVSMRELRLPSTGEFIGIVRALKDAMRPGVGFVVLCGKDDAVMYGSNAEREGVAKMLRDDLLPRWRKDAGL